MIPPLSPAELARVDRVAARRGIARDAALLYLAGLGAAGNDVEPAPTNDVEGPASPPTR